MGWGASGPDTQYDVSYSGVTTPCTYPSKDLDVTCSAVGFDWGKKLENGIHINVEATVAGVTKQIHANFDYNVPGGYGANQLGIRFTDWNGQQTTVPLTEQQVKSGHFTWNFPAYLGNPAAYIVTWAQVDDMHFNKDGLSANWLTCGDTPPLEKKYYICHATPADTAANGWNYIEVSINAIVGNKPNQNGNDGHTEHSADILPVIPGILPNGQNLTDCARERHHRGTAADS